MNLPLAKPFLGSEEREAIYEVLETGSIASGQTTRLFEEALAKKFNRKYCVVVNSGTSALYLSLKVLGIKKVLFPSMTCINVLHAVLNAGCEPVFADIDSDTHNLDVLTLPERQSDTFDGIIVTQAYGHSADMSVLEHYAKEFQVNLIEDFAQAMGGYFKGRILGSFGKVSITSFYATKNMTTGQGGAILTDDKDIYQKCLFARGDLNSDYFNGVIPLNLKMTDIQAAIGLVQLNKLDLMVNMRRSIAQKLTSMLIQYEVKPPIEKTGVKHSYYKYHLVLPNYIRKQQFIGMMSNEGISVGVLNDPPLHKSLFTNKFTNTNIHLPISETLAPRTVSLPIFPEMTDIDISKIHKAVKKVLNTLK